MCGVETGVGFFFFPFLFFRVGKKRAHTVVDARLLEIADGSGLDDVADEEALHRLVLGHHGAGRLAEHALDLLDEMRRNEIVVSDVSGAHLRFARYTRIFCAIFFPGVRGSEALILKTKNQHSLAPVKEKKQASGSNFMPCFFLFPRIVSLPPVPRNTAWLCCGATYVSARVGGLVAAVSSALLGHGDGFGPAWVRSKAEVEGISEPSAKKRLLRRKEKKNTRIT